MELEKYISPKKVIVPNHREREKSHEKGCVKKKSNTVKTSKWIQIKNPIFLTVLKNGLTAEANSSTFI